MKNLMLVILAAAIGAAASWWWNQSTTVATAPAEKKPLYWVAPMDPNFRRDQPGLSPMGMELVPVYDEPDNSTPGTVSITAAVESQIGVTSAAAELLPWLDQQRAFAEIRIDNAQLQQFQIRAAGWIEKVHVYAVGETVQRGQPLFDYYSPALVVAQEEFLVALADGEAAFIQSARDRLAAFNLPRWWIKRLEKNKKIEERIRFVAEQPGVITQWQLTTGRAVKAGENLLTIADLSRLWLDVHLNQPLPPAVSRQLTLEPLDVAGKSLQLLDKQGLLLPLLDQRRSQVWRFALDNRQGQWQPGEYLSVNLTRQDQPVLQIPSQAVINDGIQSRVVLALGDGRYKSVAVQTGRESSVTQSGYRQKTEILAGLAVNDQVVTSAQFLLDSESSVNSDLLRFYPLQQNRDDIIWLQGQLKNSPESDRIELKHQGIATWGWPAMQQNVHLAVAGQVLTPLALSAADWSPVYAIKLAALDDGDFCIVDIRSAMPDNSVLHQGMNHEAMNHEAMNHEAMNHEAMNHDAMNHEGMNHD
ncbi:efflux RND transporter periplasmic adaptor subunit [Bacterioplanoides pacificum]|uniref:Efflux RND transporter periplasmic adaptor subunit n=1 Tax=Bacterioplanoides pacificum TaxID=1171596 RepID=A0ABV7VMI3_9GAMM